MAKHAFLSPAWLEDARAIQARHLAEASPPSEGVRMNLVIRDVPFESGRLDAHLDTSAGEWVVDLGHLAAADVKVTLGYDDAKAILIDSNADVAMQAFLGGRIQVEGDMAKLLKFQAAPPGGPQQAMLAEIRQITE